MATRRLALVIAEHECDDAKIREKLPSSPTPESLVRDLSDPEIGGFEVQYSLNEPSDKVRKTLEAFFTDTQPDDLLLLFISGYGIKDENGRLYLITKDTDFMLLSSTSVSWAFFSDLLSDIPSQKKVIILDCCYIGKSVEGLIARSGKEVCSLDSLHGPETLLITPSDEVQCYLEGDELRGNIRPSNFTTKFSNGIEGEADLDRNGIITIEHMIEHLGYNMQEAKTWSSIPLESVILARTPMVRNLATKETVLEAGPSTRMQKLIRYPAMECPDRTILNERFSVTVSLRIEKLPEPEPISLEPVVIEVTGKEPPEIDVVISAQGFDIEESNTKVLKVSLDADSDVRFVLVSREFGKRQIRVIFYQYGKRIGEARRNVLVTGDPTEEVVKQPDTTVEIELKSLPIAPPADLDLSVEWDEERSSLAFRLHSEKEVVGYYHTRCGQVVLKGSPLQKMQTIYDEMNEMSRQKGADSERRMAAIGNELWEELIPEGLKNAYWRFKPHVKSMLITSEEPWIPWEIVKPYRYNEYNEREEDPFWCQQFALSRWLSGAPPVEELPKGVARPIAPAVIDLNKINEEIAFIEQLNMLNPGIRGQTSISTRKQLLELMERDSFSILHFATHGEFDPKDPNESPLMLSDGSLKPSDIRTRFGGRRPRPLVFINSCKGAQMEFGFTGLGGWAKCLVNRAYVGAFAGAMWEVDDVLALEFARNFYASLLRDRKTIAQAFRFAREKIRISEPSNSTWLAYVLYADPEGRMRGS